MTGNTGVILFAATSVLIKPLTQEFGWGRGDISLALTYLTVGIALGVLVTGKLIDRYGARRVVCTAIALSILVILTGPLYVTTLPLFYTMMLLAAVVGAPTNTIGYARVISNWFDNRRGLFIGINSAGIGLGFALAPQICSWAAGIGGWRAGTSVWGCSCCYLYCLRFIYSLLINPKTWVCCRTAPKKAQQATGRLRIRVVTCRWVRRSGPTCSGSCSLSLPVSLFSLNGLFSQLAPMLTDRGIDTTTAALVVSTMGISMAVARVVVGYIIDKLFAPKVALVVFLSVLFGVGY